MVLRLTNLKSIQFHFSKAFPTGQLKKSEGHDMISSNKIARYDETSMKPMPDVFSTLSSLKLGSQGVRPDAVRSLYASMFSEYSADGDCHHFCIHGCDSDHSPPSKRSIAAIESPWNYWSYDLSTVKSLSHNSFSTLRGVAITALVVSADDIETIVRNCPLLNDLALNHLRLRGSQGDGPLVQLLQFLRSHYEKGTISNASHA